MPTYSRKLLNAQTQCHVCRQQLLYYRKNYLRTCTKVEFLALSYLIYVKDITVRLNPSIQISQLTDDIPI